MWSIATLFLDILRRLADAVRLDSYIQTGAQNTPKFVKTRREQAGRAARSSGFDGINSALKGGLVIISRGELDPTLLD